MAESSGLELEPPRGMRDFMPAEETLRQEAVAKLRRVFKLYGFVPLATPALERFEVLASKYAGGEEILKETYSLEDQGKRKLGLRYDFTVSLARVVAANPNAVRPWPFKRYQIGQIWRDGPVGATRLREFTQCDVDIIGASGALADAEIVALAVDGLQSLGFGDFAVKVSSRKLLDGIMAEAGVEESRRFDAMLSLDKLEKVGKQKVLDELVAERGVRKNAGEKLLKLVEAKGSDAETLAVFEELPACKQGVAELKEMFAFLESFGSDVRRRVEFEPSLARGLNYYTGMVCEMFVGKGARDAVGGGGRFDDMISVFAGSREKIPAVGVSFGLDRIIELLKAKAEARKQGGKPAASSARIFVTPLEGFSEQGIALAAKLRGEGVSAEIDLMARSLAKNLDYASRKGIPYAAILGEREVKAGRVRLRDMRTGEEKLLTEEETVGELKELEK